MKWSAFLRRTKAKPVKAAKQHDTKGLERQLSALTAAIHAHRDATESQSAALRSLGESVRMMHVALPNPINVRIAGGEMVNGLEAVSERFHKRMDDVIRRTIKKNGVPQ